MSKFKVIASILIVTLTLLICSIGVVWGETETLRSRIKDLSEIAENTHSVVAPILLERAKVQLQEKVDVLSVLAAMAIFVLILLMGSVIIKYKWPRSVTASIHTTLSLVVVLLWGWYV